MFGDELRQVNAVDAPRDVEAGKAAGCRTILFSPPGVAASPAATASSDALPDHATTTLKDAIEYIAQHPIQDDSGGGGGDAGEEGARSSMSIPHHPHLPPRVESAARADDPAT